MSTDSGRRGLGAAKPAGQIVLPQPVSDKSIIDSVAGIINDIVPQAYASSGPNADNRESIAWARFEWADINDPSGFFGGVEAGSEGSSIPPLLLVLGYASGAQVWLVAASGEASEVLSWRSGPVRCLRVLPSPRASHGHGQAREDAYRAKRPLLALVDASGPQPHYHAVSFVSLRTGETVKSIRFKSAVCEVLANKRSVVVAFPERIAVFDARNLEDVLSVTSCYPGPAINGAGGGGSGSGLLGSNPVALGSRWMAYCERRLQPSKRSSGGCEAEGVSSYTATVLYAAKSLGKGLRGLGETVASSLAGGGNSSSGSNNAALGNHHAGSPNQQGGQSGEAPQPGVVSVLDLEAPQGSDSALVAHFAAHSEALVAMCFDQTGALLMTADRRGHDFHVFRLHPHPGGSSLAAVHHLYVLHRGDTSAKVQDMAFSGDARWAVVSTSRGTSHVFPVAPYGGPLGVRTHSSPHVVNRLSRFQRSAGLGDESSARAHSPQPGAYCIHDGPAAHVGSPISSNSGVNSVAGSGQPALASQPYGNPRLPPYPHPTIVHPLAQIRQPSSLGRSAEQSTGAGRLQGNLARARHQSSIDECAGQLKLCACFAPPRAWLCAQRDAAASKLAKRAVDSLFIMACHGNLIQYDLEPKSSSGVPREKVCDDTPIELEVEAKGQWPLTRTCTSSDIVAPLSPDSPLLELPIARNLEQEDNGNESRWLSQVEIFTHAGPHRRLWMGPQFVFKTYNAPSGVAANLVEAETVEVGCAAAGSRPARSNPVNMPHAATTAAGRPLVPLVIDGSGSSYEQSPRFVESYGDALDRYESASGSGENQLREDLAEAMLETSTIPHRSTGRRLVVERVGGPVAKVVNPLGTVITVTVEEAAKLQQQQQQQHQHQQQQQREDALMSSTASSGASSSKSDSVCAEEGKWAGCGCEQPESEAEALREHTEICVEMRPTREVAAIDNVPPESIAEVRELRALCAEALAEGERAFVAGGPGPEEAAREVRAQSPSPLCAERGQVPSCDLAWAASNSPPPPQTSSDEEIEHVLLLEPESELEPEPEPKPEPKPERRRREDSEPELPDMVEIIDIDAMQRALGEPEPEPAVSLVLAPPKSKSKRNKAPRPKPTAVATVEPPAADPRGWSALLEANKENLHEDEETAVKRSSSSDEASALLLLLPMDTEEEEAAGGGGQVPLELEPELESKVEPREPALPLLPSLGATGGKKASRSKKKKRR